VTFIRDGIEYEEQPNGSLVPIGEVEQNGQGPRSGLTLAEVRKAFTDYLYLPDPTVVDVVLAAYIANHMRGDPVWLLVIGAPSRGKTEVVGALGGRPDVHMLSKLTGQTLASGMRKDRAASLLYRLEDQGKRVLVLKDLTSVLTMYREARDQVLGDLREIYDGQFTKEFGTGTSIDWSGKLGLIAGVTPLIDTTPRSPNSVIGSCRYVCQGSTGTRCGDVRPRSGAARPTSGGSFVKPSTASLKASRCKTWR
jgi:hypothetical protein